MVSPPRERVLPAPSLSWMRTCVLELPSALRAWLWSRSSREVGDGLGVDVDSGPTWTVPLKPSALRKAYDSRAEGMSARRPQTPDTASRKGRLRRFISDRPGPTGLTRAPARPELVGDPHQPGDQRHQRQRRLQVAVGEHGAHARRAEPDTSLEVLG